jgi:3,4-dihydroxy 2-butanone 4-phosphate synthase/GTP cyclohydrolase II
MAALRQAGLRRLMVEGGAQIIRSTLVAGIVDLLVLTIAPQLLGGLNPYCAEITPPTLISPQWCGLGPDMIYWGRIRATSA